MLEYLLAVPDFCNITVVVFAPYILCKIVDIDPIMTEADRSPVNEDRLQAITKLTKVIELTSDAGGKILDLGVYIYYSRSSIRCSKDVGVGTNK